MFVNRKSKSTSKAKKNKIPKRLRKEENVKHESFFPKPKRKGGSEIGRMRKILER